MGVSLLFGDESKVGKLLERLDGTRIAASSRAKAAAEHQPYGATIVWGDEVSALLSQKEYVLNRPSVVRQLGALDDMAEQLHVHGIATAHTKYSKNRSSDFPFHYKVPVFNMEALTLYSAQSNAVLRLHMPILGPGAPANETENGWSRNKAAVIRSYPLQRKLGRVAPVFAETGLERVEKRGVHAIREAIKSIYALGLDFGVVEIGFPASGGPEVINVVPYPELDDRTAELYAEAMHKFSREFADEQRRQAPASLGADPEFLLADERGRIVHASRFLPKNGAAGCDVLTIRGVKRYPLAELRPDPSPDPRALYRNIRKAMLQAADLIPDGRLKWVAGGMPANGFALGGHLHISKVMLNTRLLRVLDNYLALPLVLLEEQRSARRRPRYGFLGDCRRKKHGGFEYRTLPSWLADPIAAKGVLAAAALIAAHSPQLTQRPLHNLQVQKQYYAGNKQALLPLVRGLWADMERLPGYNTLADWLLPFKRALLALEPWDEHKDFRAAWKIPTPASEFTIPQFML